MTTASAFGERLLRLIDGGGPIPVAQYMALANAHYYATRDPLGQGGDFTTAPEISQMFGELVGLWLADLWMRAGKPAGAHYVELGPGRGTLAQDALRAMRAAGLAPPIELVETSPALRKAQAERVPQARWHETIDSLPQDAPLLIVANEFFDALPVRQLVLTERGWRERMVDVEDGRMVIAAGEQPMPVDRSTAKVGDVVETSPASTAIMRELAARVAAQGGAMVAIDYGYAGPAVGDTLQAVRGHAYADPFADPGEQDLTAHVDFTALLEAAREAGVRGHGPTGQGPWLEALGLSARAGRLAAASPGRAQEFETARRRLADPAEMGELFKVIAVTAPGWPQPAGFA